MNGYLPARIIQLVGVALLVAAFVIWAVTGKESVQFVTAAMSLILYGSARNAIDSLTKKKPPQTPPAIQNELDK